VTIDEEALPGALLDLATAAGVLTGYVEHGGRRRTASRASLVAVLEALGHPDAGRDPRGELAALQQRRADELVEPITVLTAGRRMVLDVAVTADRPLRCEFTTEDGTTTAWDAPTRRRGAGSRIRLDGHVELEVGYHGLTVQTSKGPATTRLFVRPEQGATGRFGSSWRATGLAAPLFTLHREAGWGCGDIADLEALGELAATHGASVLSTLPLLAGPTHPDFEPSPYLPLSRRFWHERWIDLDSLLEAPHSTAVHDAAASARTSALAAAARAHPLVDGMASLLAKRTVLRTLLTELDEGPGRAELDDFLARRGDVASFARFQSICEQRGSDWRRWPARLRDGTVTDADVDPSQARYFGFVQWVAGMQLLALARHLESRGQLLALDLPLGIHPLGYDLWRNPRAYVPSLAVGAPPDRFFPGGQDWSMPLLSTARAREDGHEQFRAALRHHLGVSRMLRIDHVMGLQRLFCIPRGSTPAEGVYVSRPLDEQLAVIAIEASRHRAEIVGEDLGTVDAALRRAVTKQGIRRSYVVELSIPAKGRKVLAAPAPASVASFATHDLATFAGWWTCRDVDERLATGQVDAPTADVMRTERHRERARLLKAFPDLDGIDGIDEESSPPGELLDAVMDVLGRSDAGVVVTQLDDAAGELDAVNLPGTSIERPNWTRRTARSLEALERDGVVARALAGIDAARESASPDGTHRRRGDVETLPGPPLLDADELEHFRSGRNARLHERLGAHVVERDGSTGTRFAVWAPRASWVEVVGEFNGWDGRRHPLFPDGESGIFEAFVPDLGEGVAYRYRIAAADGTAPFEKVDPFASRTSLPTSTASITHSLAHQFEDEAWMSARIATQGPDRPISIYEVHLGSWRRVVEDERRPLTYAEVAPYLIDHVQRFGFTHVELMPVMDHPLYASWGYQVTSYFAPTSRYGTPDDFASLVDQLHQAGIGVVLDWVPAHFPSDDFALARFDGAPLFEHADPRRGLHPEWKSLIFDYGRGEVSSFLLSAAASWLDRFHVDGLRFDAVASMLYLDYARGPGEWEPNELGGRENLEAKAFLQTCNEVLHDQFPGVVTMAEESSAWPGVTAPLEHDGLGFDYKWDLGWMHDTLDYLAVEPAARGSIHHRVTFRSMYAASERFVLPLSHDEVVHGKGSLLARMPGDYTQRFANLRLLYGLQFTQPGKKLLFMGAEVGQLAEWAHEHSLDWHLLDEPSHRGVATLVARLNSLYHEHPALHRDDVGDGGFGWLEADDAANSVYAIDRTDGADDLLVVVLNASDTPKIGYEVSMPREGRYVLELSSDDPAFGGEGFEVTAVVEVTGGEAGTARGAIDLPALGFVVFRHT
jgi:alpha-1,4-glucan:alpha-1,4-glucan 6-glycosyltransferase/4-alpha-glucanotransferase